MKNAGMLRTVVFGVIAAGLLAVMATLWRVLLVRRALPFRVLYGLDILYAAGIGSALGASALLAKDLRKHFPIPGGLLGRATRVVRAVDDLSLSVAKGETLGVVGESGCGKSTVARLLTRFYERDTGAITIDGIDIATLSKQSWRDHLGYVTQEPFLFNGTVAGIRGDVDRLREVEAALLGVPA